MTLRASELWRCAGTTLTSGLAKLHVRRSKGGQASVHPIGGKELRALRRLQREMPEGVRTVYVFVSERLAPLSVAGYQRMVARAGVAAGFPFLVHSHMRHSPAGRSGCTVGVHASACPRALAAEAHLIDPVLSASRLTAGDSGFLLLSQSGERPEL
jgi:hypothetical protein